MTRSHRVHSWGAEPGTQLCVTIGTLPPPSCTFPPCPPTAPPPRCPQTRAGEEGAGGGSALSHGPAGPGAAHSFLTQSRSRGSRSANYVENWKKLHEPWWEMRSGLKVIGAAVWLPGQPPPRLPAPSPEAERSPGPLPTPEPRFPGNGGAAGSPPPPIPEDHPVLGNPEAKWNSLPSP